MKTAKIFKSGNSQAVRLPKEFQFGVKEVRVFRKNGDLVLRPAGKTWKDYFERGRAAAEDFPDRIPDMTAEERERL